MNTRGFKIFTLVALLSARLEAQPPDRPTSSVILDWDRVTDARVQEVRIYYGGRTHHYDGFFAVAPSATSAELTGLEQGEEYFIAAATHADILGDGQLSQEVRVHTPNNLTPGQPIHIGIK